MCLRLLLWTNGRSRYDEFHRHVPSVPISAPAIQSNRKCHRMDLRDLCVPVVFLRNSDWAHLRCQRSSLAGPGGLGAAARNVPSAGNLHSILAFHLCLVGHGRFGYLTHLYAFCRSCGPLLPGQKGPVHWPSLCRGLFGRYHLSVDSASALPSDRMGLVHPCHCIDQPDPPHHRKPLHQIPSPTQKSNQRIHSPRLPHLPRPDLRAHHTRRLLRRMGSLRPAQLFDQLRAAKRR